VKAAVCRAFGEPLKVEELELAPPGAGEVRVRVAACAICHSDVAAAAGAWGGRLPAVYGHEVAGIVEETGDGVEGLAPGDHVVVSLIRACGTCYLCATGEPALCESTFALDEHSPLRTARGAAVVQGLRTGGFAEEIVVHASQAVPVPRELPLVAASLLACGVLTGHGAVVRTARVAEGETVVVVGAGGVGVNCLQAAALSRAATILAVDPAPGKREAARAFGATHAARPEDARRTVRELTGGRGADHVIVAVGAKSAIEHAFPLVRRGGTVTLAGMPPSGVTVEVDPTAVAHDAVRILGSKMGSALPHEDIPRLAWLYLDGHLELDALIGGRYPLARINEALASSARGEAHRNVILF
jgi:Zn-dependent alcohol dehydrogenase